MICTGCTAGMPPQMSLASEEPYSTIPRRQLHPGFSGIRDNVNPWIFKPTCPQADRDSGSQTTAATLSLVHWEPRLLFDLDGSCSTCWDPQVNWHFPKLGACPQFNPEAVRRASKGTWTITCLLFVQLLIDIISHLSIPGWPMIDPPGLCKAQVLTNKMSRLQVPPSSAAITKKTPGPVPPNLN